MVSLLFLWLLLLVSVVGFTTQNTTGQVQQLCCIAMPFTGCQMQAAKCRHSSCRLFKLKLNAYDLLAHMESQWHLFTQAIKLTADAM